MSDKFERKSARKLCSQWAKYHGTRDITLREVMVWTESLLLKADLMHKEIEETTEYAMVGLVFCSDYVTIDTLRHLEGFARELKKSLTACNKLSDEFQEDLELHAQNNKGETG